MESHPMSPSLSMTLRSRRTRPPRREHDAQARTVDGAVTASGTAWWTGPTWDCCWPIGRGEPRWRYRDPVQVANTPALSDPRGWLEEHGDALFAYALRRTRRPDVAEDLVQETLLAALSRPDRFEARSTERTWLFGILRHKLLDHWRASRRRSVGEAAEAPELPVDVGLPDLGTVFSPTGKWIETPGPWSSAGLAEQREVAAALQQCLGKLPPRAAEAFLLRERHDLDAEALGQVLGTSATNVWQILHRTRAALRACIEKTLGHSEGRRRS